MIIGEMSEKDKAVAMLLMGMGAVGIGVFMVLTPAKHILQSDRKTGYSLYRQELESTGDEKRAIAAAAVFYRLFGGFLIVFGAVIFLLGLVALFSQGAP